MDRKTGEAVLAAVEEKYADWIRLSREDGYTDPDCYPQLVVNYHSGAHGRPAPFAVAWEVNSPDQWALDWENKQDPALGVVCEPIFTFVLGCYDDGPFDWARVKYGSAFVHQRLLQADFRTPETCYITKVIHGGAGTVFYRSGHPKTGFLNKCSFEYFENSVLSSWV